MLCLPVDILAHHVTQGNTVGGAQASLPGSTWLLCCWTTAATDAHTDGLNRATSGHAREHRIPARLQITAIPAAWPTLQALQEPLGVALGVLDEVEAFRQALVAQDVARVSWILQLMAPQPTPPGCAAMLTHAFSMLCTACAAGAGCVLTRRHRRQRLPAVQAAERAHCPPRFGAAVPQPGHFYRRAAEPGCGCRLPYCCVLESGCACDACCSPPVASAASTPYWHSPL